MGEFRIFDVEGHASEPAEEFVFGTLVGGHSVGCSLFGLVAFSVSGYLFFFFREEAFSFDVGERVGVLNEGLEGGRRASDSGRNGTAFRRGSDRETANVTVSCSSLGIVGIVRWKDHAAVPDAGGARVLGSDCERVGGGVEGSRLVEEAIIDAVFSSDGCDNER